MMRRVFRLRAIRAGRRLVRPPEPGEMGLSDDEVLHGVVDGLLVLPNLSVLLSTSTSSRCAAPPRK